MTTKRSIAKKVLFVFGIFFTMFLGLTLNQVQSVFGGEYKHKWKLSTLMPADSDYSKRAENFAKEVFEKTNGRISIKVYSSNALCDWLVCNELVMRNDVQMNLSPIASTYDPRLNFGYYMPYLFTTTKEAKEAYSRGGWVNNIVADLLEENGIKGIGLLPIGWAGLTAKKEPNGWREMKNTKLKLRAMPLKANQLTWERLGYIPATIPWSEAYTAIDRGVADGQVGGPPFQGWQFRDIQNVWIQYNDYLEPWWFIMNLDLFNSLTKEDQDIIVAAAERQIEGRWDYFLKEDELYRKRLKEEFGFEIIIPTDDELKRFAKSVREDVWPKLESLVGKRLMDKARKHVGLTAN